MQYKPFLVSADKFSSDCTVLRLTPDSIQLSLTFIMSYQVNFVDIDFALNLTLFMKCFPLLYLI